MSPKKLFLVGASALVLINGSVFGTIYIKDWLAGPSEAELAALKQAEENLAKESIYAKLTPLEPFKSKAKHVRSIGEAVGICAARLNESVKVPKSWDVNMATSRFIRETDLYMIFMEYETIATRDNPKASFSIDCEVDAATKTISNWKALPM